MVYLVLVIIAIIALCLIARVKRKQTVRSRPLLDTLVDDETVVHSNAFKVHEGL
jgi:hypothetical protein